jgi:hypothetical protein
MGPQITADMHWQNALRVGARDERKMLIEHAAGLFCLMRFPSSVVFALSRQGQICGTRARSSRETDDCLVGFARSTLNQAAFRGTDRIGLLDDIGDGTCHC